MTAGLRYYVEVVHKAGTGSDLLNILWHTPEMGSGEYVIVPGSVLSPFVPGPPPPANGLLACYAFSGNANDGSGQGNHGTVNGATLTTDRFGNANSAYSFSSQTNHISIPATSLQNNTYTYSLWAKTTSLPALNSLGGILLRIGSSYGYGDQEIILSNLPNGGYPPSGNNSPLIGWEGISFNTSGTGYYYSNSQPTGSLPMINTWYHLVMTRSSSKLSFYVNGQLIGAQATNGSSASYTENKAVIGDSFYGTIDDIQIYNKALSAAEVTALYQQTGNACPATTAARQIEPTEEGLRSQLKAYPNPTTGATTVEFTAVEAGWLGIQLYNMQGQPLQQLFGQAVEASSVHQRSLDATLLPSGLYLIRLVNGKRVEHHKLLVSH